MASGSVVGRVKTTTSFIGPFLHSPHDHSVTSDETCVMCTLACHRIPPFPATSLLLQSSPAAWRALRPGGCSAMLNSVKGYRRATHVRECGRQLTEQLAVYRNPLSSSVLRTPYSYSLSLSEKHRRWCLLPEVLRNSRFKTRFCSSPFNARWQFRPDTGLSPCGLDNRVVSNIGLGCFGCSAGTFWTPLEAGSHLIVVTSLPPRKNHNVELDGTVGYDSKYQETEKTRYFTPCSLAISTATIRAGARPAHYRRSTLLVHLCACTPMRAPYIQRYMECVHTILRPCRVLLTDNAGGIPHALSSYAQCNSTLRVQDAPRHIHPFPDPIGKSSRELRITA